MVVEAFQLLMQEALDRSAIWLQGWTWVDMFSMLGWDRQMRLQTSTRLQQMSAPLFPVGRVPAPRSVASPASGP